MKKMKMHSPKTTQANIGHIRELFPSCVTEVKREHGELELAIDFDLLRQELSESIVEGPQERYHLNWPGKREALLMANTPIAKTLRPCREESVDFDTTKNLFIEGDNLEALKLLQETYLGKVKMIYIDPPYNTGNDFLYKDDFAEGADAFLKKSCQKDEEGNRLVANTESNGRFHSDWLSMMYPRLKLARNLLRDDGVIFVSVDDNEMMNLKKLFDEIFGGGNFISTIVIQSNKRGQTYRDIAKTHEYILVFSKTSISILGEIEKKSDSFPYEDSTGKFDLWELRNRNPKFGRYNRPNLFYPIYVAPEEKDESGYSKISLCESEQFYLKVFPVNSEGEESCWRWGSEKVKSSDLTSSKAVLVAKQKRDGGWNIYEKSRKSTTKAKSIWDETFVISEHGTVELGELGFSGVFDHPKPVGLLQKALQITTSNDDIILDFFAGSSTTAHAVMQLNAEDGGNRKFIMVQLPEPCDKKSEAFKAGFKTIAEISKERIRRAGKKILEGDCHESWNKDIGFRVFKIDSSNMAEVYYTPDCISQRQLDFFTDNIKSDRTPEDLLFQVLLDWGVDLSLPVHKNTIQGKPVFFVDDNALIACFDKDVREKLVKELATFNPVRVVFRNDGFKSDAVKINVEQIFKQMSPGTEVRSI